MSSLTFVLASCSPCHDVAEDFDETAQDFVLSCRSTLRRAVKKSYSDSVLSYCITPHSTYMPFKDLCLHVL